MVRKYALNCEHALNNEVGVSIILYSGLKFHNRCLLASFIENFSYKIVVLSPIIYIFIRKIINQIILLLNADNWTSVELWVKK